MVEFHFYSRADDYLDVWLDGLPNTYFIAGYDETYNAFNDVAGDLIIAKQENLVPPERIVHTLQMSFLTWAWDLHFEYGARVFIHDHNGTYEVLEGDKCERTDRYLRRAHNLFKLWRAGEFWSIKEDCNGK